MKSLFVLLAIGSLYSPAFAQTCGNFTGDYSTGAIDFLGRETIWTLAQDGCRSLAVGSYFLKDDKVTDVVPPSVMYVSEQTKDLCEIKNCTVFESAGEGIAFDRRGLVTDKGISCRYDRVEWSLDEAKGLKQKYFLADPTPACRKQVYLEKTLKRVR